MFNSLRTLPGKIAQEYRDLIHFVRHDHSTEARIARALITVAAAYLIAVAVIQTLTGLGLISITFTGSTTALIQ